MKKFQFWITGFLLLAYTLSFQVPFTLLKHPEQLTYLRYDKLFNDLGTIGILFVFLLILGITSSVVGAETDSVLQVRQWWMGFACFIAMAFGIIFYVNPHARFSGKDFPPLTPSARSIKAELYSQLNYIPDIIIFGSSRSFTLSPEYIKERTGRGAYNMSVEGGRVGDYEVQLNRILRSNTRPRVLLIEVGYQLLGTDSINPDLQPLILMPYMPMDMALSVAETSLRDTLSVQSLSDSIYILTLPNAQTRQKTWIFNADGMGERRPISHDQYKKLLADTIPIWLNYFLCDGIDASLAGEFEKTIEVARDNQIAIVLYESPVNSALPIAAQKKDPKTFSACHDLLNDYFSSLSRLYPNVFFRDLSDYKSVNDMGEDGFYDAVHLKPVASELVIDALLPEIELAINWSLKQKSK